MIGKLVFEMLWKLSMIAILFYCVWLFADAIDVHLTTQIDLWNKHLGM